MKTYDIIIIGGGPAGLAAGIYAARARMQTLLIEKGLPGGQMALTEKIENYPGFPDGIAGVDLAGKMEKQAKSFGLKIENKEVAGARRTEAPGTKTQKVERLAVKTSQGDEYSSLSLIIAAGSKPGRLGVPGEDRLQGRGVSYCATCDGPLFRDKEVAVVGGGDAAVEEALFLTRFCSKVTIIHRRDRLRAAKILQERALSNKRIGFAWNSIVVQILGKEKVEGLRLENLKTDKKEDFACQGVFVFVGIRPNTDFLRGLVDMDKDGYILTGQDMKTSKDGIYACGDARSKLLRQVVTACGEGAAAAEAARHYVENAKCPRGA